MSEFQLTTPVAFIIFNRPDTTERVFAEIARARPPKLLVVGDGPRANRSGEAIKVAATRAIINRVDWPCEVLTNFSETNLGCKVRVSSGLDWVFEQVPEAIILEDDCLPHPTFFRYCEELLDKYRLDTRISQINGVNLQSNFCEGDDSYYFSKNNHIWGWATWADRWRGFYDVTIKSWPRMKEVGLINNLFQTSKEIQYWYKIFDTVHQSKLDTWDYQWVLASWSQGRLAIMPSQDLILNIGFGPDATHTTEVGLLSNLNVVEMNFPLRHPQWVYPNRILEKIFFERFTILTFSQRLKKRVLRLFNMLRM